MNQIVAKDKLHGARLLRIKNSDLKMGIGPLKNKKMNVCHVFYCILVFSVGRTMYVIPFSMGPVGSTLSKYGVQVLDCARIVSHTLIYNKLIYNIYNIYNRATKKQIAA